MKVVVRLAGIIVLALVAVLTGAMLVSLQYGLVAEYDSGGGFMIFVLAAVLPIGAAVLSGSLAGWGRATRASVLVFTLILAVAMVAAYPLGSLAHDRRTAENDRTFSCNGPNAEAHVDARVDAAFHEFPHPAPLYGPLKSSLYGCSAGIYGPAEETFGPWREVLLASGWTIAKDADRVKVIRGGLVAVLYRDGGTTLLQITADEPTEEVAALPAHSLEPLPRISARSSA